MVFLGGRVVSYERGTPVGGLGCGGDTRLPSDCMTHRNGPGATFAELDDHTAYPPVLDDDPAGAAEVLRIPGRMACACVLHTIGPCIHPKRHCPIQEQRLQWLQLPSKGGLVLAYGLPIEVAQRHVR